MLAREGVLPWLLVGGDDSSYPPPSLSEPLSALLLPSLPFLFLLPSPHLLPLPQTIVVTETSSQVSMQGSPSALRTGHPTRVLVTRPHPASQKKGTRSQGQMGQWQVTGSCWDQGPCCWRRLGRQAPSPWYRGVALGLSKSSDQPTAVKPRSRGGDTPASPKAILFLLNLPAPLKLLLVGEELVWAEPREGVHTRLPAQQ